jgi:predicted O-linked N-acetylglucosamine transferase (SPINDLY family)
VGHSTSEQLLRDALAAQRRGSLADAKRLYASALKIDPGNAAANGNLAIIAAQEGDLASAERLLRRGISLRPDDATSLNNLGTVLLQQGRLPEAIASHRRAIELKPAYAEAHFALGNAFKQQGGDEQAIGCYRSAIALRDGYAEAHNNAGVVLQRQRRLDEAILAYENAIASRPDHAEARFNLGVVLHEKGEFEAAVAAYRAVIALQADIPLAHNNLGTVLLDQGRLEEALAAFDKAVGLAANFAEAHYNRGIVLQRQVRFDEALAAYHTAVALRPNYLDALNRTGIVLGETGRAGEAIAVYRRLLDFAPEHVDALNNMGAALLTDGRPGEALQALQQALTLKPDFPEACYNLGNVWRELGKPGQAIAAYGNALRLRPDYADCFSQLVYHRWRACDWRDFEASQQRLIEMVRQGARVPPFYLLSTPAAAADQLTCAGQWIRPMIPPRREILARWATAKEARIRVGYLSGDFHQHATAHLTAELIERHDRQRFEVIGYSYGPDDGSPMRARLARAFDRFVDIGSMSHRGAAARIHADKVGILVDLKGYTQHARPQICSYRPAPVQVSYLGYPATMGADFIDYILVDKLVVPSSQQPFFSEKLVHLPDCYQANDRKREIAATAVSREECGLPENGFVFCSFNNSYKITPRIFDIWMRLLKAIPNSVLWLLQANELVETNLRSEAAKRGTDPDRLVFAPILPPAGHLARHRKADLFLDTLPCNAHTTASDALWAGLPLLTCVGDTFAGRVAASLLAAVGLPELITASLGDYERAALALAGDPARLAQLRTKLQRNRDASPLFDLPRLTGNIETAYVRMWETWRAGQQPAGFSVED